MILKFRSRSDRTTFKPYAFFNPDSETQVTHGNLPHWEQRDAIYFITFRTADSMPEHIVDKWIAERDEWLNYHGINPDQDDWRRFVEELPDSERLEFHREFTTKWHQELDSGHGECVLRQPELAGIVAGSLKYFHGERYHLFAFVVMPNHVHVLTGMNGRGAMKEQCRSWKKWTATEINRRLKRRCEFWQTESFDHLVRSEGSFHKFRRCIEENPVKARLRDGGYVLYVEE